MEKGIIVVDMPGKCVDCGFCREISEGIEACREMTIDPDDNDFSRMIEDYCQSKPDWCPIKPMPERKEVRGISGLSGYSDWNLNGQDRGWNAYLDEIEGRR